MNDAVAILECVLEARRNELATIEADEADAIAATLRDARPGTTVREQTGGTVAQSSGVDLDEFLEDDDPEVRKYHLAAQIAALQEVRDLLNEQHPETQANFLEIKKRDNRSSKQSFWLTLISSIISLIIGWTLSLLGTPASHLHVFGR